MTVSTPVGETLASPTVKVGVRARILSFELAALPDEFASITDFAVFDRSSFLSTIAAVFPQPIRRRLLDLDAAWKFFRQSAQYEAIVTLGDLPGLMVAFLRRLSGRRQVHVMYDCLWYGGNAVKRAWMRYCFRSVDRCVVWSSIECDRYARAYTLNRDKFVFVPHHHTIHKYSFEVADDGYMFAGGNWSRDYRFLVDAVRTVDFPCVIATNRSRELLHGIELPPHVKVVSASSQEFRTLMSRSTFVVLPLEANHLHAGGQQTIVNAMAMGKPVIVTDPEGARDYVHDGVDGFLVPFGDRQALSDAMRKLVNAPNEVRSKGQSGRDFAKNLTTSACNEAIWREVLKSMSTDAQRCAPKTGSLD